MLNTFDFGSGDPGQVTRVRFYVCALLCVFPLIKFSIMLHEIKKPRQWSTNSIGQTMDQ